VKSRDHRHLTVASLSRQWFDVSCMASCPATLSRAVRDA
jgi:hypothetical protein